MQTQNVRSKILKVLDVLLGFKEIVLVVGMRLHDNQPAVTIGVFVHQFWMGFDLPVQLYDVACE